MDSYWQIAERDERDERAAARFRDRVEETLRRITRFPELGSLLETPQGPFRVRQVLRYPRLVIIYRLTDTLIDVARIVRGMRNFDLLFK